MIIETAIMVEIENIETITEDEKNRMNAKYDIWCYLNFMNLTKQYDIYFLTKQYDIYFYR